QLVDRSVPLYKEVRRVSSCNNEVIHPWTLETVPDKQFPAKGPVYQEAPKPLPGLAGESRSADANGSWVPVLAARGKNLLTFSPGRVGTAAGPVGGANPAQADQAPAAQRQGRV